MREYPLDAKILDGEQGTQPYVATFLSDAGSTTFIFYTESSKAALQQALRFEAEHLLPPDHAGIPTSVLQILIADASGVQREVWNSEELHLRRAAPDLREALKLCSEQLSLYVADIEQSPEDTEALDQAVAALAKAEGGAA